MIDDIGYVTFREEWGARSPGWFEAECTLCGSTTTGTEPTVEDWAHEHNDDHEVDARDAGFPG